MPCFEHFVANTRAIDGHPRDERMWRFSTAAIRRLSQPFRTNSLTKSPTVDSPAALSCLAVWGPIPAETATKALFGTCDVAVPSHHASRLQNRWAIECDTHTEALLHDRGSDNTQ